MADSPWDLIQSIRFTLIDHITHLWTASSLTSDEAEAVTRRLLAPLGRHEALKRAARMHVACRDRGDLEPHIIQAVAALLGVMGRAFRGEAHHVVDATVRRLGLETPLAGDSLTTAREGVTGTPGAGSNEVPVTPAGVTYVREAGWHVWSCGSCGEGGSGLAKSVAEAAYAAHSCPVTPAGGASWLD